jgi:hypothetical protein
LYEPFAVEDDTLDTVGATPSTTRALFEASDPDEPPIGKVRVALFPFTSSITPLKADVD